MSVKLTDDEVSDKIVMSQIIYTIKEMVDVAISTGRELQDTRKGDLTSLFDSYENYKLKMNARLMSLMSLVDVLERTAEYRVFSPPKEERG